jgi:hypothetical protein
MAARRLSERERLEAWKVFRDTIPYDRIAITSTLGFGERPFTLPNPWPWDWESWDVHFGTEEFWRRTVARFGDLYYWQTLIHELTHVWQGSNAGFPFGYVLNSLWHQAVDKDPYEYRTGGAWSDYNVEQQAHLVEDWYQLGCREDDPRFPYIRDIIRKGSDEEPRS